MILSANPSGNVIFSAFPSSPFAVRARPVALFTTFSGSSGRGAGSALGDGAAGTSEDEGRVERETTLGTSTECGGRVGRSEVDANDLTERCLKAATHSVCWTSLERIRERW